MRSLAVPFALALSLAAIDTACASPPLLDLTWNEHEVSMDSNGTQEHFVVAGNKLSYTWDYSGYHPNPKFERHRSKRVTLKDPAKIQALLADAVKAPRTFSFPPRKGPGGRDLDATLIAGGTTIHVTGRMPEEMPKEVAPLDRLRDALLDAVGS